MTTIEFCKKATQDELIVLFNQLNKMLVKQYKIKNKSALKELNTKCSDKKQYDTLFAKSYNDCKIYNQILNDIKIVVKYLI